ncbi:hypothetical protein Sta7437_2113 [Stanieria cyanosphaera PCC 7437]|uniref:DUF6816 domain-containing protein n=1 Tax=Stanieria cyanosphaera (strain ATCC 29371 / PCC 7437) TaxID=111780 RepID=K9XT05_STAC7|nr:hypothetical protein [Stanieria cyanosphaera]AFZ35663.1 hypothetical protein Sta7437_2113 [Stanieria cyanosphaera PCC 7437]
MVFLLRIALFLLIIFFSYSQVAVASVLADRIEQYPNWNSKPPVQIAKGDLVYPEWINGTWNVTSTLTEQVAPLAPDLVTPGFETNQKYLNQPVNFQVRFGKEYFIADKNLLLPQSFNQIPVVADRVFNSQNIAQAYLGNGSVFKVKVDPENPNQQITLLKGGRKLISTVTERASEIPNAERFIATEVTQQLFRSPQRIYLNKVETTTSYQLIQPDLIKADQFTAIYLSPQDPDYFKAINRPVAIYRYRLSLQRNSPQIS